MELVEWQIYDEQNGLVFPWLTHPMLRSLRTWSLADKVVLEYGSGLSTVWWAKEAKRVVSIETNQDWTDKIRAELKKQGLDGKAELVFRPVSEADFSKAEWYTNAYQDTDCREFDIVVVDGIFRNECMKKALELLSRRGGTLIADNWQQDYVWLSGEMVELMKPFPGQVFVQPNHTNHEGNPWKTAYWTIPPSVL